jgi:Ca2+-dependent lipid-binding protein
MHMNLVFYLGIKGLFGVPLPIFVELQSLVGTVRLRMHMTPEAPFLKTLTFTLMGTPQVTAGCTPMSEKAPNLLNLPLISNFVNYAIKAAASSTYPSCDRFAGLHANKLSVRCAQVHVS